MMHLKTRAPYPGWRGGLYRWFGLITLVLLLAQQAGAQNGVLTIGNKDSYVLSRAFTYLEDSSAALTLDDVLRPDLQARFRPVVQGGASTNFGATNSAIWLRLQLHMEQDIPGRWLLEVANPPLDRLDLYLSNPRGGFDHQTGGDSLPFAQRPVPHRNHVKPVDLEPGGVATLYLRVASQGTVSVPTTLWQPAALWHHDQRSYAIFGLYFGLLLGLWIYNLLLFLSVRDRAYLIYVFFVACIGLSQAANSGLAAQFLWPDALWWNNNSINAAYSAGGTFGVLFARSFLATRLKMPALDRWMLALTGLWIGAVFCGAFFALQSRVVARNSAGTADRGDGCICRGRQHPAPPPRRGIFCACLGRIAVRCRHPGPAQKCWRRARKRSLRTVWELAYTPKIVR